MNILWSILSSIWKPIAAIGGGLIVFLFQRWRINKQKETIEHQEEVIKAHETIEEVHKHDKISDSNADKKISEIRDKVDNAETEEQAANEVSSALNDLFGEKK